ncbi:hypothetical protein Trydic_g6295 [Trypoxylus dichotomus]
MGLLFRSMISLTITLVLLQHLARYTEANPVDVKPSLAVPVTSSSPKPEPVETPKVTSAALPEAKPQNHDEILETANSMVFRPLFVYRQQQAQRKRVYENKKDGVRRNDAQMYYPYGYPSYGYSYYRPNNNKPQKRPYKKEHHFPTVF